MSTQGRGIDWDRISPPMAQYLRSQGYAPATTVVDARKITAALREINGPDYVIEEPKPKTLHGNVPTTYRGRRYDSKAEAKYAEGLDLLKEFGDVAWWIPQVRIELGEDNWTRVDFLVARKVKLTSWLVVEAHEVKGHENARFRKIRKLWPKYGICPLHVIKRGKDVEVIEPCSKL